MGPSSLFMIDVASEQLDYVIVSFLMVNWFPKMLCSSIKLTDRREFRQDNMPKRNKSTMLEEKLFMKSDYYHSYTFRWDKPKKRHYSCNNPQHLTVKDIIFPQHLSKPNHASLRKWPKKKPNRKFINALPKMTEQILENEDGLNISVLTDQLSKETEELIEEIKSNVNIEDEEVDPDVQKLITSARESETARLEKKEVFDEKKNEDKKRKRNKKKDKNEEDEGKKDKTKSKTKVIKFSLSKPPTPQTVQVIRVDVISNFSMEEDCAETNRTDSNVSDCSKGCGTKIRKDQEIKENLHKQASLSMELGSNGVNLMCRKLTLKDRNDEIGNI